MHTPLHWPDTRSGSGYAVCACGATCAVYHGRLDGIWHECGLCVQPDPAVRDLMDAEELFNLDELERYARGKDPT